MEENSEKPVIDDGRPAPAKPVVTPVRVTIALIVIVAFVLIYSHHAGW